MILFVVWLSVGIVLFMASQILALCYMALLPALLPVFFMVWLSVSTALFMASQLLALFYIVFNAVRMSLGALVTAGVWERPQCVRE